LSVNQHIDSDDLRIQRWGLVEDGITFTSLFKPGQVLFGKRRAYLRKVAVPDFAGVCSGDIYVFESANPQVLLLELLPFICQTDRFFEYAIGTSAGSLSPRTNWKSLVNFEFGLPSLEEQKKVIKMLSLARDADESEKKLLLQHNILKSSLINRRSQQLISRGVTSLKEVVKQIESGKSPGGLGRSAEEYEFGVLKVSAVGDWNYHPEENKAITESEYHSYLEVKPGDLLATRANADPDSVGRTCLVNFTRPGLMLSDKTWRIELNNPDITIAVLAWTKSTFFRKHIRQSLSGTEAKNISQKVFLDAPFPKCSQSEIKMFDSEIRVILDAEANIFKRTNENKKVFKALLARILGE
jgi:type I restriction enzyme, S subunit